MRKVFAAMGAGLLVAFGFALIPLSASAADAGHYPTADWQVRDWTGATPGQAAESEITDANTVKLTKPSGAVGTSVETADLNIAGGTVTVHYALSGDAATAAGAIRLFAYNEAGANTLTDAPDKVSIAEGDGSSGDLTFHIEGTIGTLGLTYDASNDTAGTVTFTNLKVGGTDILFIKPVVEPSGSASATPTATASASATPSASESASPSGSASPSQSQSQSQSPDGPMEITPTAPKIGKVTCDQFELLTDEREGLNWEVTKTDVNGGVVTVTVVVTAAEGYKVVGQTEWTLTFDVPDNCTATPQPTEVPTSPAAGALPVTGSSASTLLYMLGGGLLLVALGGGAVLYARRSRDKVEFTS